MNRYEMCQCASVPVCQCASVPVCKGLTVMRSACTGLLGGRTKSLGWGYVVGVAVVDWGYGGGVAVVGALVYGARGGVGGVRGGEGASVGEACGEACGGRGVVVCCQSYTRKYTKK